jgi:tight adherence protein C
MTGLVLGAFLGAGLVLVMRVSLKPRQVLADAISPYVGSGYITPRNLTQEVWQKTHEVLTSGDWAPWGSNLENARKLRQSANPMSLATFRRKQISAAGLSLMAALVWTGLRLASEKPLSPLLASLLVSGAFVLGGWYAKWELGNNAAKRIEAIEAQLPAVLDLLAFAVAAGEPVLLGTRRIANTCSGPLVVELQTVVSAVNAGESLSQALSKLDSEIESPSVRRAIHALNLALERGTPLAQVLRAQAADARAHQARTLLVLAGRKETAMMLPVVFLILPMIVAVALYPGMVALQVL